MRGNADCASNIVASSINIGDERGDVVFRFASVSPEGWASLLTQVARGLPKSDRKMLPIASCKSPNQISTSDNCKETSEYKPVQVKRPPTIPMTRVKKCTNDFLFGDIRTRIGWISYLMNTPGNPGFAPGASRFREYIVAAYWLVIIASPELST